MIVGMDLPRVFQDMYTSHAKSFEIKSTLDVSKNYYSTLAENLLKKLPTPPNRYTFNFIIQYHGHFIHTDAFQLTCTTEIDILKS